MSTLELQEADASQLEVLLPLVRAYHRFENIDRSDPERVAALAPLLEDGSSLGRVWLIRSSGAVVGYLALCFGYSIEMGGRDAFIDELFVTEGARGRGLGRLALVQVQQKALGLGLKALHLEVASTNERARRLYARVGFQARQSFQLMTCSLTSEPGGSA